MIHKFKRKFDKTLFCYRHSAGLRDFFSIVSNSKKLRWSKKNRTKPQQDKPVKINFVYNHKKRDLYLRTYEGDFDIFYEVLYHQTYHLEISNPENIKTIVDLGANIGLSAIYFLSQFSNAEIICIEPDPGNYILLTKNLTNEISTNRATCINAAVASKDGTGSVQIGHFRQNTKVSNEASQENPVLLISLNNLLKQNNIEKINLLKIDIEGGEEDLFTENTEWLKKTDHIIIELHSERIKEKCIAVLVNYNFTVKNLRGEIYHAMKSSLKKS